MISFSSIYATSMGPISNLMSNARPSAVRACDARHPKKQFRLSVILLPTSTYLIVGILKTHLV